jgi:PBP1b-binding outer membrane lipoprotein LpoB
VATKKMKQSILILITAFCVFITGCATTKVDYIKPNEIEKQERSFQIITVYLKDGSIVDLNGREKSES